MMKKNKRLRHGSLHSGALFVSNSTLSRCFCSRQSFKFTESYGDAESIEDAYALIIPSFGVYLALTIILVNKFISKVKGTADWITKAANAVGKSKTVAKLPEGIKKWR